MSVRLRFNRGDEFVFDVTVTKDNEPVDLADHLVHFVMKSNDNTLGPPPSLPKPVLITKSTVIGGISKLPEIGRARIFLIPQDTAALPNKTQHYVFEVKVKEPDGSVFTVLEGEIIVDRSVNDASLC